MDQKRNENLPLDNNELEDIRKPILEKFENEGHPYYSSARLWDDGVINPADTRSILIHTCKILKNNSNAIIKSPVFRM